MLQPPRLLDQVRATLRRLHYSLRTEKAYVAWIIRFVRFHGTAIHASWAHPKSRHFSTILPSMVRWRPRICSKPDTISARFRSCLGMPT